MTAKKILITTVGSLGDVYPYIAIASGLKNRGLEPIVATCECYRQNVEASGLRFEPIRPDVDFLADPEVMKHVMHPRNGTLHIIRRILMPSIRQSYEDTARIANGVDLLVSHTITYATRLVAEQLSIPWASCMITPVGFFSAHDPPIISLPRLCRVFNGMGPWFWRGAYRLGKWATRPLARPWFQLRAELGLGDFAGNPLVDVHSPNLVLAPFSDILARPQPDWPANTVVCGFPRQSTVAQRLPDGLAKFLATGEAPVLFTLGASSAANGEGFFRESAAATEALPTRAVFVTGESGAHVKFPVPAGSIRVRYADYAQLFPQCRLIVHSGGIGTTGLAMHSGVPSLVVPHAHDQPDNAHRLSRLGIARVIYPRDYVAGRVAAQIAEMIESPDFSECSKEIELKIRGEDGVAAACEAIERMLEPVAREPRNGTAR